ncbi:hypothetical protein [Paraburkholderia caballeronis]|uniref:Right handed beta helix region n=1 Tax=Paraburkholderia caballeronis TaxID=416943 RepID=A0A1H7L324_9BURK|nr:hypothetical protein [Paraburkholderia caballeronis]PXW28263.1 hypothetical protein C7403_102155 [Paraburkholderia caballeronis]PXX03629.1 hypothetical protein C7407_102155 [Paraburkholderia caballeronis]RAK04373.1 hypothetical protein C7409_102155 [Paraburkholderia caballeronis]SED82821.1 hypothetical protein SAMN05445871_4024 [Paraburkholderia caballeronis]SEK93106.1 hypothetical protein SAMN05192542_104155 [Paraburkholderia caballeronis]
MGFNGQGRFNLLYNWQQDAAQGLDISSSRMLQQEQDIAAGLSNCITKDGQTNPVAPIPMNGQRLTGLGAPTQDGDAVSKGWLANNGSVLVGFTQLGTGAVERTILDKARDIYVLADFDTAEDAVAAAVGKRLLLGALETVTLNVPSALFPTVNDALDAIAGWAILGAVAIQVADGTYHPTSQILLNHPFGANCHLIGNQTTPANCVLTGPATPTFDLIVCSEGNTWGTVSGFQLDLPSKPGLSNNWTGLLAVDGAKILNAPNMRVNNWYYGIAARNHSYINAPGHYVSNGGDVNVWAFDHSFINGQGGTSVGASDTANGWGCGYLAEYGSGLDCSGSTAQGCNLAGMASYSNSQMRALGATSNDNVGSGFYAVEDGHIECHNSNATGNERYGVEEVGQARIQGNNLNLDGNTLGPVKPVLIFDNSTLGPRLTTNVQSDARFDVVGNGHHYFNGGEGLRFEVRPGSSGANRVYVQPGATGNPATIGADGSDAVIDLQLLPKGPGSYVKIGAGFGAVVTPNGSVGIKINDGSTVFLAAYKP